MDKTKATPDNGIVDDVATVEQAEASVSPHIYIRSNTTGCFSVDLIDVPELGKALKRLQTLRCNVAATVTDLRRQISEVVRLAHTHRRTELLMMPIDPMTIVTERSASVGVNDVGDTNVGCDDSNREE